MKLSSTLPDELFKGLRAAAPQLMRVAPIRNRVAHNRPLEIDDLPTVLDFANFLISVDGWDWSGLRTTLTEIQTDPGYIFRVSANLIVNRDGAVTNNLPAPDFDETSLLGRKDERKQLLKALRGAWPVISILGDGGIGKTALALQVCYDLVEQPDCPFEAVVWVSAKNSQLTSTEILRIESAVEDSLGLFASAAAEWGASGNPNTAIDDLIEVLESFPTLLVLDNVETILDESFPRFLREVPVGSKVLITSRIGVKTENPFKLSGLSEDDAIKLLRILAKSRNLDLNAIASDQDMAVWAQRMKCHPAYIKWFVSGLQAGKSPEKLLDNNGLVLDFCMSNVFEFLGDLAKKTLRAMLVAPGAHTMAELSALTRLDSSNIQKVILELTTTNFVAHVRGGASGTALELSDFARDYLRRKLRIDDEERREVLDRHRHLYAIGGGLKAAHALDPYAPETIDIRGAGDYSAARLLREAIEQAANSHFDEGLRLCTEASELAPGYHEVARVEAHINELSANFWEASESYSRAKDLAPDDPYIAFFYGNFMVRSGFDPSHGIRELQRAATLDPESSKLHVAIASAFSETQDFKQAMYAAAYAVDKSDPGSADLQEHLFLLWQNSAYEIHRTALKRLWNETVEHVEFVWSASEPLQDDAWISATLDLMLWVERICQPAGDRTKVDDFIVNRITKIVTAMHDRRTAIDGDQIFRRVGEVKTVNSSGGYGFLKSDSGEFFFHARDLWQREWFDSVIHGSVLVFTPGSQPAQGRPKATSVHWVR